MIPPASSAQGRFWLALPLQLAALFACSSTETVYETVVVRRVAPATSNGQAGDADGPSPGVSGTGGAPEVVGVRGSESSSGASAGGAGSVTADGGVSGDGRDVGGEPGGGGANVDEAGAAGAGSTSCNDANCGVSCAPCAVGQKCLDDSDCSSSACDAATHTCVADACNDHRQDGLETDADCGGPLCKPCQLGNHCAGPADCASLACDAVTLRCVADPCADHRQDGTETDVDCGGALCGSCEVGKKCKTSFDCAPAHVCAGVAKVCQ